MVNRCELTDAAVVETPVAAANGDTTIADVVYFDPLSGKRAILEVSVVTMGSETSQARTSNTEMGAAAGRDGSVDGGLPEDRLCTGEIGRQEANDTTAGD